MEFLANRLAMYVVNKEKLDEEKFIIYRFGFQVFLEVFTCSLTSILIALYLNMLMEGVLFFILFIPLRDILGGGHLDKFWKCYFCSEFIFLIILLGTKYINIPCWIICIISIFILFFMEKIILNFEKKNISLKRLQILISVGILFLGIFEKRTFVVIIFETILLMFIIKMCEIIRKKKRKIMCSE